MPYLPISALAARNVRLQHMAASAFFDTAMPWSSLWVKKGAFRVIHCDKHTIKQQIIWRFSDKGVVYIVAKSRCIMALAAEQQVTSKW